MLTAESLAHTIAKTPSITADSVVAFLKSKGAVSLLPRVLASLQRIAEKATSGERVVVATKKDTDAALASAAVVGIDPKHAQVTVDDTLIGGYIVSKKGSQIDTSYKSALLSMYRAAVRS